MADEIIIHPDGHTSADRIPGEHDTSTLMHRQPGAIGGKPNGEDIPQADPEWDDAAGRHEHERDGGGPGRGTGASDFLTAEGGGGRNDGATGDDRD